MKSTLVVAFLLVGCASGVKVTRWVGPPKNDPGPPGPLFVEVAGSESGVKLVQPMLEATLKNKLQFELVSEKTPGVPVLHCQVERWHQVQAQAPQQGRPPPMQTTEYMQLAVTLTRADGKTMRGDYAASQADFPRERATGANDLLAAQNARAVLQQFLDDFTPVTASQTLEWDEDPSAAEGLALAKKGDLAGAEAAWRRQATAAAHYNLGVLLESKGDPASALAEYAAAAAVSNEPRYVQALDGMKKSAEFATRR
jgi:hypothetical protein